MRQGGNYVLFAFPQVGLRPQGRMRDEPAEIGPLTGSDSKPAPHPPSGGASGTFPQGGRLYTLLHF